MDLAGVGTLLLGLGAVGTLVHQARVRPGKHLREINQAVNNVGRDDGGVKNAPLWKRIDEQTLLLGEINGGMKAHFQRDDERFDEILDRLDTT